MWDPLFDMSTSMVKAVFFCCTVFVLVLFIQLPCAYGQVIAKDNTQDLHQENNKRTENMVFPQGFAGIALQDTRESVLKKLENHTFFHSPDEPNITLLPSTREQIIEVVGKRFIRKALFQFNSTLKLVVITLYIDTDVVDYFSVYMTHEKKYGRAQEISPAFAMWQGGNVIILLEKPLQVKYMYTEDAVQNLHTSPIGEQKAKVRAQERDEFLSFF